MKCSLSILLLVFLSPTVSAQPPEGWSLFAKTKFEAKYNEKSAEYFLYPGFAPELKSMVGKEVSLEGYYMPIEIEGNAYIILSKYPYSQCFFCGAAGPETIAEVKFRDKQGKFEMDQYLRVKGKLKLNEADIEHGNFILEDAVMVGK
ncbi:MAG: hypothetical protein JNL40_06235 [Cyclobacteriaceae bacterium]|nr:hypothetical protein [Cyclobacteriaceae bacterium]